MNTLVLLAILVLGCLALDIVILIITMQLMVRIEDVQVADDSLAFNASQLRCSVHSSSQPLFFTKWL